MIVRTALLLVLPFLIIGCDDSGVQNQTKLERFVERNQIGRSQDAWLELHNSVGEWERVGLITGYFDDAEGCQDIADLLEREFGRQYRCNPVDN